MRLRDLIESSPLGLTPVTGAPGLERELGSVMVTDLPDPSRYLRGGGARVCVRGPGLLGA